MTTITSDLVNSNNKDAYLVPYMTEHITHAYTEPLLDGYVQYPNEGYYVPELSYLKRPALFEEQYHNIETLNDFIRSGIELDKWDAEEQGPTKNAIINNLIDRGDAIINTIKHSTGGPLYPFSFNKNPLLKTPTVRH